MDLNKFITKINELSKGRTIKEITSTNYDCDLKITFEDGGFIIIGQNLHDEWTLEY
jgi:hypothetical protein